MLKQLAHATLYLSAVPLIAQVGAPAQPIPTSSETIRVATTVEPLPFDDSDRSVQVLSPHDLSPQFNNLIDQLRSDPSLNLQARAPNGVQADLSLRGTTFEQSLVLVNGLRVNDPETGHLNLDIPVPLDAVTRVDILHGSGSTFYGSDAIGGALNLLTSPPKPDRDVVARFGGGSYGSLEEHLRASFATRSFADQVTGSRDTSDGFIPDRNYSSNAIANESWITSPLGDTDLLLAASDRPYGANLFYGPYNSWERTKGWLAQLRQDLGASTAASFSYRRHTDQFVLFADRPAVYQNNHITSSYELAVRHADQLRPNALLSYGFDANADGIQSNSLGHHGRNQGAGYANLSLRSLGRFSLSAGAREEVFSGGDQVFSPSVAAGFAITPTLRLRASAGHGFRLPTYVDLYYADPTTIGNPGLKPESSWSYEAGLDWRPATAPLTVTAAVFRLQQSNVIDYAKHVLATPALTFAQPWQAINVSSLDLTGGEATAEFRLRRNQRLTLSYTAVQAGSAPPGILSEYAYNFAAQNAVFAWTAELPCTAHQFTAETRVNIVQKTTRTAYPLWDLAVARNTGRLRPYFRASNLSNTGYQEIPQVPLQGRTLIAGLEFHSKPR